MAEITSASTKVARMLRRLHADFPLGARVRGASAPARQVYANVLVRWLSAQVPPRATDFPRQELAELAALDAVVPMPAGLSAYPFSAADTGIWVCQQGRRLGAMCAIDALAVPVLAGEVVTIEAMCEGCNRAIVIVAHPDGRWETGSDATIRVRHPARRAMSGSCSSDLCPAVRFVLAGCETSDAEDYLDIDEAIVVAHGMFAFQVPLILAEQKRLADSAA